MQGVEPLIAEVLARGAALTGVPELREARVGFIVDGREFCLAFGSSPQVTDGVTGADLIVTADGESFAGIVDGTINPQIPFLEGKLTVAGDLSLLVPLSKLLKPRERG